MAAPNKRKHVYDGLRSTKKIFVVALALCILLMLYSVRPLAGSSSSAPLFKQKEVVNEDSTNMIGTTESVSETSLMVCSIYEAMNAGRRNTMEDVHVVCAPGTWGAPDKDMAYLAVYDGHGGRDMVDFLEKGLIHHVAEELGCQKDDADTATRLERAFLMADIHSHQAGVQASGATVALCLVKRSPENPNRVHITTANAGDSRIVLGYEGQGIRLTHDHCMDDPLEVARIEKAGGFLFKGRVLGVLAVTRSLGDHMLKDYVIAHPTVNERTLELNNADTNHSRNNNRSVAPTFLIIACDGLWDVMRDQEAVNLVQQYPGEKTSVAQYLVEEALRRGSTDNVTAIVAWL